MARITELELARAEADIWRDHAYELRKVLKDMGIEYIGYPAHTCRGVDTETERQGFVCIHCGMTWMGDDNG